VIEARRRKGPRGGLPSSATRAIVNDEPSSWLRHDANEDRGVPSIRCACVAVPQALFASPFVRSRGPDGRENATAGILVLSEGAYSLGAGMTALGASGCAGRSAGRREC